jgi:hypothetical protein
MHGKNLLHVGDDANHEGGVMVSAKTHKHHPAPSKMELQKPNKNKHLVSTRA